MDDRGLRRIDPEAPSSLDLANRKGVEPNGERDQKSVKNVCGEAVGSTASGGRGSRLGF
jgi:hypothetical protein